MKHAEIVKRALLILCAAALVCCAGCGKGQTGSSDASGNGKWETPASQNSGPPEDSPAGQFFAKAVIDGGVVAFSGQGCVISPTQHAEADGGSLAMSSAPGQEDPEKNVEIQYGEKCKFQTAIIDPSTGAADIREAAASDVKKQSSLFIQGSRQDDRHVTATLITIVRYSSF